MVVFWLIALILFLALEAATAGLTSIWFAVGSLAALISSAFGAPLWLQIIWFILVSAVTLFFTRPLARKYLAPKHRATNADRVIDMPCLVTEKIDNISGVGTVSAGGKLWSARSMNGDILEKGTLVRAVAIEGVKLIVAPVAQNARPEEDKV